MVVTVVVTVHLSEHLSGAVSPAGLPTILRLSKAHLPEASLAVPVLPVALQEVQVAVLLPDHFREAADKIF